MNVVVKKCGKKVVCSCNSVHVTREVKVNVLHGNNLSITAACSTALNTHNGTERGLTESYYGIFTKSAKSLSETYGSSCLAFACRSGVDGCCKNKFTVGIGGNSLNKLFGKLCFIFSVKLKLVKADAYLFSNLCNRFHFRTLCNLNISKHFHRSL